MLNKIFLARPAAKLTVLFGAFFMLSACGVGDYAVEYNYHAGNMSGQSILMLDTRLPQGQPQLLENLPAAAKQSGNVDLTTNQQFKQLYTGDELTLEQYQVISSFLINYGVYNRDALAELAQTIDYDWLLSIKFFSEDCLVCDDKRQIFAVAELINLTSGDLGWATHIRRKYSSVPTPAEMKTEYSLLAKDIEDEFAEALLPRWHRIRYARLTELGQN